MVSDPPKKAIQDAITYRAAGLGDVGELARIRASEWGTIPYWQDRISGYIIGKSNPGHALAPRTVVAAVRAEKIVGFAAAHLTRRLGCSGELQWINIDRESRGLGIATGLLGHVAHWFVSQESIRVCVDPDDEARAFYVRLGAQPLGDHWLVWPDISVLVSRATVREKSSHR